MGVLRTGVLRVGVMAAGVAVLVGCSSEPPEAGPSASPSPTGGESATPTVVESPPSSEPTIKDETAEEFIRRWMDTSAEFQRTGDPASYMAMQSGCDSCRKLASKVGDIYSAGGVIEFGGYRNLDVKAAGQSAGNSFVVQGVAGRTRYRETKDGPWRTLPGGEAAILVTLSGDNGDWAIAQFSGTTNE